MKTPIEELVEFLPSSKYLSKVNRNDLNLGYVVMDIEKRLNDIEHKGKKNKRIKATRAQKFLLFKHLGLLDGLMELPVSTGKKARLLSVLLDEDQDNLEGDISTSDHPKSDLNKDFNYKFLVSLFKEVGLKNLEDICDKKLDQLEAISKK